MKNEIKDLYKKDPKLAKKVAKVLGYKIKSRAKKKTFEDLPLDIQKILKVVGYAANDVRIWEQEDVYIIVKPDGEPDGELDKKNIMFLAKCIKFLKSSANRDASMSLVFKK